MPVLKYRDPADGLWKPLLGANVGSALLGYGENVTPGSTNPGTAFVDLAGGSALAITFTAPPSGKVLIRLTSYIVNLAASGQTNNATVGLRLSGPGLNRVARQEETISARGGQVGGTFHRSYQPPEALTPGALYTLTFQTKHDAAGVGTYTADRTITVEAVGSSPGAGTNPFVPVESWTAIQTGATANPVGTTPVPCPNTQISVPTNFPTDRFLCIASMDVAHQAADSSVFIGDMVVNGVVPANQAQLLCQCGTTSSHRHSLSQHWIIDSLPPGPTTFSLQAKLTIAGNWIVNATHTKLTVIRLSGGTVGVGPTGDLLQRGFIPFVTGSANAYNGSVTFPIAYSAPPTVVATSATNAGIVISAYSVTTTGFQWRAHWADGAAHSQSGDINWIAMGPP